MTYLKLAVNTLTYAIKITSIPKVLLQPNKSTFSKQKGYTDNKYTETMTCSKLAANALGVNQKR